MLNFLLFKLFFKEKFVHFFVTFFVQAKKVKKSFYIFFKKENSQETTGDQWSPLQKMQVQAKKLRKFKKIDYPSIKSLIISPAIISPATDGTNETLPIVFLLPVSSSLSALCSHGFSVE